VSVLALESIGIWPVWSSCFGASSGQTFSAGWLAIFLLSVSACDWRVVGLNEALFLKRLWLNAESGVGTVADLNNVWLLLNLDKILGIWSASWVSHIVWHNASSFVITIADWNCISSVWSTLSIGASLNFHGFSFAWVVLVVHWVAGSKWGWLLSELVEGELSGSAWIVFVMHWVASSQWGWLVLKLVE